MDCGVFQPADGGYPMGSRIAARTRRSQISMGRFTVARPSAPWKVGLPAQDAFYLIVQLRDQPPHEYGAPGKLRLTPEAPRGCFQIADLREEPSSVLRDAFDALTLLVPRAALDDIADEAGAPRVAGLQVAEPWQTRDPQIRRLLPLLVDALDGETGPLFSGQLLLGLTAHLCEAYGGLRRHMSRTGGLAPWQERRAKEMIADDLGREASLVDVASECRLSASHFSRAFKASTGLSPHAWLQRRRVERARELLREAGHSLAEVSLLCGFADQSHFSRVFRRAEGISPGAWRRWGAVSGSAA